MERTGHRNLRLCALSEHIVCARTRLAAYLAIEFHDVRCRIGIVTLSLSLSLREVLLDSAAIPPFS